MPPRKRARNPSPPPPPAETEEDQTCCVCLTDDVADRAKSYFPCAHFLCDACFARVEHCPKCRRGKDGSTDDERRAAGDALYRDAHARAQDLFDMLRSTPRVVHYVGGDPGPFAPENMTISTSVLPRGVAAALPQLLESGFFFNLSRRRVYRRTGPGEAVPPEQLPSAVIDAVAAATREEE
jgi:hypothetical protein